MSTKQAARKDDARRDMAHELAAAAALKEQLKQVLGEQDLDAATLKDMIEGETSLLDLIRQVVLQIGEDSARQDGLKKFESTLAARRKRFEDREEALRTMLLNALELLEERKLELDVGTVTVKPTPPKVTVVDEALIPSRFFVTPEPALSKSALTTALKERDAALDAIETEYGTGKLDEGAYRAKLREAIELHPPIPGAEMSNGGLTVAIRFG